MGFRFLVQVACSSVRPTRCKQLQWVTRSFSNVRTGTNSSSALEFEHAGDQAALRHLPKPGLGGFTRGNFLRTNKQDHCVNEAYEFTSPLGEGACGTVCVGKNRETGESVAVKSISKNSVQDAEALGLEIEFLKLADHPNIVRFLETFEDSTHIHLVMELCSGGELWQRILAAHDMDGCFTDQELAAALQQMLRAVAYCHSHSIVHRDLKPQNFLYESGVSEAPLKLVDFGVSGVVPADQLGRRFLTKQVGTDGFMAPEVLLSQPYGSAADIFSLGAIMHTAIVGFAPRWNPEKLAYDFPGRMRWRTLSSEAQDLLSKLLDPDAAARPTAAEAMQHPWFISTSFAENSASCVDAACLVRLKEYSKRSKLQRAAMTAVAAVASLRNAEMESIRNAFIAADTDCRGEVSFQELATALQSDDNMNMDLENIFSCLDASCAGQISYSEWITAAASEAWSNDNESARRAFATLDSDGDGIITCAELQEALPGVFHPEELKREIGHLDVNRHGGLDFNEFCTLLQSSST